MANEKQKCPMCNTKLKMINGRLTCKSCGYYYRNPNETADDSQGRYAAGQPYNPGTQYGSPGQTAYAKGQGNSPRQTAYAQNQSGTSSHTNKPQKKPAREKNQVLPVIGGIAAAVIAYFVAYSLVRFATDFFKDLYYGPERSSGSLAESSLASSYDPGSASEEDPSSSIYQSTPDNDNPDGQAISRDRQPQSDFFQQLAEAIWGKAYSSITPEEYAGLTALQIDRDEKNIFYQLDHGETMTLTFQSDFGKQLSDLRCFTGLEFFSIDDSLSEGDLDGLDSLNTLFSENSIQDLLAIVPNPENILELGITDPFFSRSLEGLDSFPNLQYLTVEYAALEDISALSQLPELLGLSLTNCSRLTDFSPLMDLTALQELAIESVQLKTIDFIQAMPELTYLDIRDSMISDLDALASCPMIDTLCLTGNYYIEDYTGLDSLENLVSLELELNYSESMPSFQNLSGLQQLSLIYANDLSLLRNAPNVTYLRLEHCAGWELEAITSLQELTTLEIHEFSSYTESLEPLTRLPKLAALDLEDTCIYGDISEIFGIPTLYYLNLTGCRAVVDFNALPSNDTLQCLLLDDVSIADADGYDEWGAWESVELSDHYDIFDHFPNLTDLYLESTGIDSIDFVEKLPRLQYLDITDNHVTSLKPLEALPDFRTVWCGKNTILENLPEDSNILVITSGY